MAGVQWIKIYIHMFDTSRKIKQIEKMQHGDTLLIIWIKLLCMAGDINDGGAIYITPDVPFDEEALADELRRPPEIVQLALATFQKYGMIFVDDAGFILIANWEKYQNVEGMEKIREQNRIRQAKFKAKQKALPSNVTDNVIVTDSNGTEEEREEDKELEKENSFIQSGADSDFNSDFSTGLSTELSTMDETKRRYMLGTLGKGVVMLSDEQMDDLLDHLSVEEFDKYVSIVADMELQGKRYRKKTHYQAILDMAMKDRRTR